MKNFIAALLLTGAFGAPMASAVTIFQDDFNDRSGRTVGNGWSEIERHSNDVAISGGVLRLRDRQSGIDAAASQLGGFSTIGLTDIMLSYDWGASNNTEADDSLFVEWRVTGSSNWTELMQHALGGSSLTNNVLSFGTAAANQANIEFRFYTSVTQSSERALIDNVLLTGRAAAVAVTEPTTLVLIAVAAFALRQRRRMRVTD